MLRDPIRIADTRAWLMKAEMDLKAAAHELTAAPPFTGDAVFHAQQAAEKALKAPPALPANVFAADEILEFREENLVKAAAAYRSLSSTNDRRVRAEAPMRLARCFRKQRLLEDALAVYGDLAAMGETPVAGSPSVLVAHGEPAFNVTADASGWSGPARSPSRHPDRTHTGS